VIFVKSGVKISCENNLKKTRKLDLGPSPNRLPKSAIKIGYQNRPTQKFQSRFQRYFNVIFMQVFKVGQTHERIFVLKESEMDENGCKRAKSVKQRNCENK
jgi:hypothetical protein